MGLTRAIAYLMVVAMFTTLVVMLSLQIGGFRRHRHTSFLVLSIATVSGLFYLTLGVAQRLVPHGIFSVSTVLYLSSVLLLVQMIFGVWGTASLFKSYGRLSAGAGIEASMKTPNNRIERSPRE